MEEQSRYIIGIDLGTTNTCVAFVDTDREKNPRLSPATFGIPQFTREDVVEPRSSLPSTYYIASEAKFASPWSDPRDYVVGSYALDQGARIPTRWVRSAKSWLCNNAASRRERLLPLECVDEKRRISPVEASTAYLEHVRDAWNHVNGHADFDDQEVVLTVPASFDEVARKLTVEAAQKAGFRHVTLLEEPLAAFYAWLSRHEGVWEQRFRAGEYVLVCDVGGGTTDFTIIALQDNEGGKLGFQRMAVGQHLLLGGDNLDSAIACWVEGLLSGGGERELSTTQHLQLVDQARRAKETLVEKPDDTPYSVIIQGSGASVVGGSRSVEIRAVELRTILTEGFFGQYDWEEAQKMRKTAGIRGMGLPYEDEPSITKHLAAFLKNASQQMEGFAGPQYVLFNGGTMRPTLFQQAVVDSLNRWYGFTPAILKSDHLDLAVAHGAAYCGRVRRGLGVRVKCGLPRTYYMGVEVEGELQALTLMERGAEEGTEFTVDREFQVRPNTPVAFKLFSSDQRLKDKCGDLVAVDEEHLNLLAPIFTSLRYGKGGENGKALPVKVRARLSEVGVLEVWLDSLNTPHCWELEFQLRSASGQEDALAATGEARVDETFDHAFLAKGETVLRRLFGEPRDLKPNQAIAELENSLEQNKTEWAPSVLRGLWSVLLKFAEGRHLSPAHAVRWWNLAGFFLRPGFGYPLDDHRIKDLWKVILSDYRNTTNPEAVIQQAICFRRIAGGLSKGQQTQLFSHFFPIELKDKKQHYPYTEKLRCLAAMELVDVKQKVKLGDGLVNRWGREEPFSAELWAVGRLGARRLLTGSAVNVVPRDVAERWLATLLALKTDEEKDLSFALRQLTLPTDQRELNLADKWTEKVRDRYGEPEVSTGSTPFAQAHQEQIFGDHLPAGLTLSLQSMHKHRRF